MAPTSGILPGPAGALKTEAAIGSTRADRANNPCGLLGSH
jgi:hypothetical protein